MRRGIKQIFSNNRDDDQQQRQGLPQQQQQPRGIQQSASAAAIPLNGERRTSGGILGKIFRGPQDEMMSPLASPAPLRRSGGSHPASAFHSTTRPNFNDWYDGGESGDYAEIRARSTDFDERGKRREYSAPLSPKTVKFEDELEKTATSGPLSPSGLYSKPDKYRFQPIRTNAMIPPDRKSCE
jgi:hypothetical protein